MLVFNVAAVGRITSVRAPIFHHRAPLPGQACAVGEFTWCCPRRAVPPALLQRPAAPAKPADPAAGAAASAAAGAAAAGSGATPLVDKDGGLGAGSAPAAAGSGPTETAAALGAAGPGALGPANAVMLVGGSSGPAVPRADVAAPLPGAVGSAARSAGTGARPRNAATAANATVQPANATAAANATVQPANATGQLANATGQPANGMLSAGAAPLRAAALNTTLLRAGAPAAAVRGSRAPRPLAAGAPELLTGPGARRRSLLAAGAAMGAFGWAAAAAPAGRCSSLLYEQRQQPWGVDAAGTATCAIDGGQQAVGVRLCCPLTDTSMGERIPWVGCRSAVWRGRTTGAAHLAPTSTLGSLARAGHSSAQAACPPPPPPLTLPPRPAPPAAAHARPAAARARVQDAGGPRPARCRWRPLCLHT
jgi:hypothetical protein